MSWGLRALQCSCWEGIQSLEWFPHIQTTIWRAGRNTLLSRGPFGYALRWSDRQWVVVDAWLVSILWAPGKYASCWGCWFGEAPAWKDFELSCHWQGRWDLGGRRLCWNVAMLREGENMPLLQMAIQQQCTEVQFGYEEGSWAGVHAIQGLGLTSNCWALIC